MPPVHPLLTAMHVLTAQLESDLRLSASIGHNASMGASREQIIRDRFAPYIPSGYSVVSGVAINAQGEFSEQLDLMIVDERAGRPFVSSGNNCVVPVELIHACFQVKTRVSPSNIAGAVHNIGSFLKLFPIPERRLDGELSHSMPFTAIVSFEANRRERELFESFVEANLARPPHEHTECLLVPGRLLTYMARKLGEGQSENQYGSYAPAPRVDADHWAMPEGLSEPHQATLYFYLLLSGTLALHNPPFYSPWDYAAQGGLLPDGGLVRYWDRFDTPEAVQTNREGRATREKHAPRTWKQFPREPSERSS